VSDTCVHDTFNEQQRRFELNGCATSRRLLLTRQAIEQNQRSSSLLGADSLQSHYLSLQKFETCQAFKRPSVDVPQ
jgi:hypothetical protein